MKSGIYDAYDCRRKKLAHLFDCSLLSLDENLDKLAENSGQVLLQK